MSKSQMGVLGMLRFNIFQSKLMISSCLHRNGNDKRPSPRFGTSLPQKRYCAPLARREKGVLGRTLRHTALYVEVPPPPDLDALYHATCALSWSILIQNWIKNNILDYNLERERAYCAPSGSAIDEWFWNETLKVRAMFRTSHEFIERWRSKLAKSLLKVRPSKVSKISGRKSLWTGTIVIIWQR